MGYWTSRNRLCNRLLNNKTEIHDSIQDSECQVRYQSSKMCPAMPWNDDHCHECEKFYSMSSTQHYQCPGDDAPQNDPTHVMKEKEQ